MEQQPSEVTFRRRLGRDRGENFSLPYGVADCAAPPVSKRRLRSGPNLHPGDTHHCADGLFARDKHLVHDSANARSLVLFLARPRAGAAGVETCMDLARLLDVAAAKTHARHGVAHRPVPSAVDVETFEPLLQRVQEQALAEAPRTREEVACAAVGQPAGCGAAAPR